ncbi:MAG TPA: zinc-dependent metalloprotease family protein [bacterium]
MKRRRCLFNVVPALVLGAVCLGGLALPGPAEAAKPAKRSPDGVWTLRPGAASVPGGRAFSLDTRALNRILAAAPSETVAGARRPVLSLPLPGGAFARFRIERSPILSPALAQRYRSIRTYRGQGVDDPAATARLDVTPLGFHAQIISRSGTVLVDPAGRAYRSVRKQGLAPRPFACGTLDGGGPLALAIVPAAPSGDRLRTYRLAITATGEYTTFFGGEANAAAQIVTTVNRATGIYEPEVAVRFVIAATRIFTDPATDPFPTGSVVDDALLGQNQAELDANVGAANYDIGHIVTAGPAAGLAGIGVTCADGLKARGATALPNPVGDPFDVDVFSHVVGHQMGAHHTFNGTTDGCGATGRDAATAYEPGSGSTIMGLAGRCGAEDVQAQADAYFHTASFDEITAFRDGAGAACGVETPTGNNPPLVAAGPGFTIPRATPFTLTATATDADGDALSYCWEQFDLGAATPPPNMADGPLFRSRPPVPAPARTFPALADLLAGTPSPWERLPEVDRTLTFRVTARDNRAGGGGVNHDGLTLTVSGEPFLLTAPASGATLECGDVAPLAWQVGGGSVAADVRALFSADGGATFSELLASTPNDGAESITVPTSLTAAARVRLDALGNVFFALSGPLSVTDTKPPVVTAPPDLPAVECTSPAGASPLLGLAVAADLCDAAPAVTNNAPAIFPFGTTTVTWTGTDASGNSGTDAQLVTVVDTTPPSIDAPPDVVAECTSPLGTPVDLGTPVVSDVCDDAVTVTNDAPALFPLGMTTVLWTAVDNFDNSASDSQKVTVRDTTAPVFTVTLSPAVLWPPNHRLVTIRATIVVRDACDAAPAVRLVSVVSDEPDNGRGDGNTVNDVQGVAAGTDDREFQVRAERAGGGDGRVYTVTYEVQDASGNVTTHTATVTVPHDQGR